ncbi:ABC transporter permease [Sphingobacterium hungaricum]|uniref:ABC transporter permease n=1 Tax=Sphingobacterium hungaricum TaxID=2082723 RepID=UPI0018CAFEC5|nr:ABC transporter permease [Sphingobacterium hungaricum]
MFSLLNIFGLAISLAVAILLIAYANQKLSFNKSFENGSNIFRVNMETTEEYNFEKWSTIPNSVGPAMLNDVSGIEAVSRLVRLGFGSKASIFVNNKSFAERNIYLTDSSFFQMFDMEFIEGDRKSAFSKPKSVVISESQKVKIFGNQPAFDQTMIINQQDTLTISGVFADLPKNTSFDGDIYTNIMDSWMGKNVYWSNASYQTFCLLNPNANVDVVQKETTALIDKYVPKEDQYFTKFILQPLADIHLYSNDVKYGDFSKSGNINAVKIVVALSILILLIACINYMNLATARSQKNAKEVGVNKVLGAKKNQIAIRFYTETAIISLISILIGFILGTLLIPVFNALIGSDLSIKELINSKNLILCFVIWCSITLIGGSYPALFMSKIPTLVLMNKNNLKNNASQIVRKGLVVFQFTCTIVLIICVLIISLQMRHVREKDLGFQPDNAISISLNAINSSADYRAIRNSIQELPETESFVALQSIPGNGESGKNIRRLGDESVGLPIRTNSSGGAVIGPLQLHLLAGKDLPNDISKTDSTCYILINEIVCSYLGFKTPEEAIGQNAQTQMGTTSMIVGVVRNFNFKSLKEPIGPYLFYKMNNPSEGINDLVVRYSSSNVSNYVNKLQSIFTKQIPNTIFDYQFMDDYLKEQYVAEDRTNNIITTFSLLTIIVACLGLLGLVIFVAEQRSKEISIRKVLGASFSKIIYLLAGNFLGLVLIALCLAIPLGYWISTLWLNGFSDRITIPWWSFVIAGAFSIGITALTIGYQAIRSALANPVDSLRNE